MFNAKNPTNPSPSETHQRHCGNAKVEPEHVELVVGHILSFEKKNFPKTIPYWWTISGTLRVLWIVLSNKYGPHHKYYLWFDATTSGPMAGANDFVFR